MKIHIKTKNLDLTPSLNTYADEKFNALLKLVKRFDEAGSVDLWLELERTSQHHRKGEVFKAEADLKFPKQILHAEAEAFDLRAAIDMVKDKLHLELEKYKTRTEKKNDKKTLRTLRGK